MPTDLSRDINEASAFGSPLSAPATIVRTTPSSLVSERVRSPSRILIRWLSVSSTTVRTLRCRFGRPLGLPALTGLEAAVHRGPAVADDILGVQPWTVGPPSH